MFCSGLIQVLHKAEVVPQRPMLLRFCFMAVFLAVFCFAMPSFAALKNENLSMNLPDGYKLGFQTKEGKMIMAEYVPAAESVDNWTKMITVQIFQDTKNADPSVFANRLLGAWKAACPISDGKLVKNGVENGYPFTIWLLMCIKNPQTNKPENMWLKVISGSDALYTTQYAVREEMGGHLITPAMEYLRTVGVCDTRREDRPCAIQ